MWSKKEICCIHRTKKGISYTSARARINLVPNISHVEKHMLRLMILLRNATKEIHPSIYKCQCVTFFVVVAAYIKWVTFWMVKKLLDHMLCTHDSHSRKTPFARISIIQYFYYVTLVTFFFNKPEEIY